MPKSPRRAHADDLRAASRLLIDATTGVTGVVEQMHKTIASGPALLGQPFAWPMQQLTGLVYSGIRGVTNAVGRAIDRSLAQLAPFLGESQPGPERLAVIAALNGVIGDFLERTRSPLALPMELCRGGVPLDLDARLTVPKASGRLVVLVHGSAMSDLQWNRLGHDHGAALERDAGCSAVYVRYNSGLHVSTNGAQLAALLERLVSAWPVKVQTLTLLGFSMGGLVARSACHVAERERLRWRPRLKSLVCVGTPHHGSPLERSGNWVDTLLGVSRYSAPIARLGKIRSAGVTDLRFGYVLDAHWQGHDRFAHGADEREPLPLPRGVHCAAVAATRSSAPGKRLRSDGLVPVASALGQHEDPKLRLDFPRAYQHIVYSAAHLDLLNRPEAYAAVRSEALE